MSVELFTVLWLSPLIVVVLYVWRQTVVYRRKVREDRERFYANVERPQGHRRLP